MSCHIILYRITSYPIASSRIYRLLTAFNIKFTFADSDHNVILMHYSSFLSVDVAAVAYDALPYLSLRPETTIFNAKRFIGGNLNDSATQSYATAHPYRVVPCTLSKHSKVGFELSGYDSAKAADTVSAVVTPENVGTEVRDE